MEGYETEKRWFTRRIAREVAQGIILELVPEVAQELTEELRRGLYEGRYRRLRDLDTMSEKLIYHHLLVLQPQTFTSIRRALNIGKKTVGKALEKLLSKGYIIQDDRFLYWLTEP